MTESQEVSQFGLSNERGEIQEWEVVKTTCSRHGCHHFRQWCPTISLKTFVSFCFGIFVHSNVIFF